MTDTAALAALLEEAMRGGYVAEMPTETIAARLIARGVSLAAPAPDALRDDEASLAWSALAEAIRHAAILRTESVTIQAPLARYLARILSATPPAPRAGLDVERLRAFANWAAQLDDPANPEHATVTLTQIAERAQEASDARLAASQEGSE